MAVLDGAGPSWFALGRAGLSGVMAPVMVAVMVAVMGRLRLPGRADLPTLLALGVLQLAAFFALSHISVAWVGAGRLVERLRDSGLRVSQRDRRR